MTERTTVRLPDELLNRARRKAAAEGRTLTSLMEEGLRWVVCENRQADNASPRLPRVSAATGGTMPGVDLSDTAELQEAEDLDYLRRSRRRQ
ncbi:MAG TPA: hypothetical protein VHY35_05620 [Stellaceae bacterium]|jgi:hypothetical protein|nr:hypothetical protein [Stellaceae bacterium]